jgi:hypothetical protein
MVGGIPRHYLTYLRFSEAHLRSSDAARKLVDKGGVAPTDRSYRQPLPFNKVGHLLFLLTRELVARVGAAPTSVD